MNYLLSSTTQYPAKLFDWPSKITKQFESAFPCSQEVNKMTPTSQVSSVQENISKNTLCMSWISWVHIWATKALSVGKAENTQINAFLNLLDLAMAGNNLFVRAEFLNILQVRKYSTILYDFKTWTCEWTLITLVLYSVVIRRYHWISIVIVEEAIMTMIFSSQSYFTSSHYAFWCSQLEPNWYFWKKSTIRLRQTEKL